MLQNSWRETVNLENLMSKIIKDQKKFNTFRAFVGIGEFWRKNL